MIKGEGECKLFRLLLLAIGEIQNGLLNRTCAEIDSKVRRFITSMVTFHYNIIK